MSFYDFDEDGWDDLTFPTNSDSILFYRNVNGTFEKIDSYVLSIGLVRQILWVDYDNDLDLDLCISYHNAGFQMFQNDGSFNFLDVTASVGITTLAFQAYGFSFADPDADGDLDLYVSSHEIPGVFVFPQTNFYYENQGNGTFIEKGQQLGIDNGLQPTFMPAWFDYNNDNHLDLAIINDKQLWNDALYTNQGNGTFVESAVSLGISNEGHNPMSLSIADFDNDGFQDIFKTDVGSAGLINGVPLEHKLFQNNGGSGFTDIAQGTGLDTNLFAWGALWVDYDNDSFEDLYIATVEGTGYESLLFRNNQGLSFDLVNDSINGNISATSYCPLKGDINNDGFYDILVLNEMVDPNLLLNSGNGNNYIKVDLLGNYSNQKGIGSRIEVFANGEHQTQTVFCGSGMGAQNSQHKIFGVGTAAVVDSIKVTFPSGIVMTKFDLAVNAHYTIAEQIIQSVDFNAGIDTVLACEGEQFDIGIAGWSNYAWNTGSQNALISVTTSGIYYFEASNLAGDTLFVSTPVYFNFEPALNIVESTTQPQCGALNGGAIELVVSPSQLVQGVSWSNGLQGLAVDSLPAGTFSYTIQTNHGCLYDGTVMIQNSPVFTTQVYTDPVTDITLGTAEVFAWGGIDPYTFMLDGDTVSNPITNLDAGSYSLVITDSIGCSDTVLFTINDLSTASTLNLNASTSKIFYSAGFVHVYSAIIETLQSIEIYNMMGAKVQGENTWEKHANNAGVFQEMEPLSPGVYRVVVHYQNSQESISFVIQ